jgi:hypothetical protein
MADCERRPVAGADQQVGLVGQHDGKRKRALKLCQRLLHRLLR